MLKDFCWRRVWFAALGLAMGSGYPLMAQDAAASSPNPQGLVLEDKWCFEAFRGRRLPLRRQAVAAQIDGRGWEALNTEQRLVAMAYLFEGGTETDDFSVRWRGLLTPPTAGTYTFTRRFVPACTNDWMKVWIGEDLVLDTSDPEFVAPEVRLQAIGVALKVEHSRDVSCEYWPVSSAVLGWKVGDGLFKTVPASAFKTSEGDPGLSAEYFDDPGFKTLFAQRTDTSLDIIWDGLARPRAANPRIEACRRLAGWANDPALIASWFDAERAPAGPPGLAGKHLNAVLLHLPGTERQALIAWLMTRPELLVKINGYAMADLLRRAVTVSEDGRLQADLLVAWLESQDRYTTRVECERSANHGYLRLNWDALAHCGKALSKRRGEHISLESYDYLIDEVGLAKQDGSPNLRLIPVLTYGLKESGHRSLSDVAALIDEQLEDVSITGDRRAQWLVAKAMFDENNTDDEPNSMLARRSLDLAYAQAKSEAVRFWVLHEHAGRLAAMGDVDELRSLLDAAAESFTTPQQQAGMQACLDSAARWADKFDRKRDQQPVLRQQELIASLQARLDNSVANGNTNEQARYTALVAEAQRVLTEIEQDFAAKWVANN